MEMIEITKVKQEDVLKLQYIGRQTFFETFSEVNTEADMEAYLKESFAEEKLRMELENINSRFFFAKLEGEVIGYLKINQGDAQTEEIADDSLEIERIYVLRQFQGKKVGQLLYDKAIKIAREIGKNVIWLGVWEENFKAIRFYEKNGFVVFDKHFFRMGDDEQTDIMMKKELDSKYT